MSHPIGERADPHEIMFHLISRETSRNGSDEMPDKKVCANPKRIVSDLCLTPELDLVDAAPVATGYADLGRVGPGDFSIASRSHLPSVAAASYVD